MYLYNAVVEMSYRKHTEGKKPWTTGKEAKAVRVPALKT
jgi:hypothetical protein